MRFFPSLMLGSLLPLAAALAALTVGCDDGHHHMGGGNTTAPDQGLSATPEKAAIDTDATLTAKGGDGVGVFVQYAAGGHWTLETACDTSASGVSCGFDLYVGGVDPATILSGAKGQALVPGDGIEVLPDGSVHFQTVTGTGLDSFSFDATPGATVELEMYLDGVPQPRFVYWIGGKVLHTGAPTDPIDLAPSAS